MSTFVVTEFDKFCVSLGSLILAVVAGVVGLNSFLRNERWKRAEFLAKEMKDFFADARIQKTLTLIDWGIRRVQLLPEDGPDKGWVIITRELQVRSLRPHTLLQSTGSDPEMAVDPTSAKVDLAREGYADRFTHAEAAIRDCYDGFLDGLERISSYVRTGVVDISTIRPYLGYWIDDIYSSTENKPDAAWTAALLTYITFYQFEGVLWLFKKMGRDISVHSTAYLGFLEGMEDQELASRLAGCVKVNYPGG